MMGDQRTLNKTYGIEKVTEKFPLSISWPHEHFALLPCLIVVRGYDGYLRWSFYCLVA